MASEEALPRNTCSPKAIPVAEKTYVFQDLDIGTLIRNPKKVGLFGYR